ncbi:MAG: arginine deiminase [Mycoplasmataceae bacterium]|nr:arginine deiminase [Mycoplasmataceae bacterium]
MKSINVYSEIGELEEVLVHTPGDEIRHVAPSRLEELLFSAELEPDTAIKEHKSFVKILKEHGVKVVQLVDLCSATYDSVSEDIQEEFIEDWLNQAEPKLNIEHRELVKKYLKSSKNTKEMIKKMISGIRAKELNIKQKESLIVDPMPNLYFTRDPFASIGNGISLNSMKYKTRKREVLFSRFIFTHNKKYKNVPRYFDEDSTELTIEGGDIFIYNEETLVIGNSERTNHKAIISIAKNIKNNKECKFKKIIVINVPPMPNLMHLDTWITMLDYDKFLYSPNMMTVLKFWEIDLQKEEIELVEKNENLEKILHSIIGKKPILIPVGGKDADQLDIDIETHFDATNYLVIKPGVVIGYDRNKKTQKALKEAGIKVLPFEGDQLSLGMGSARCMSMPLIRKDLKKK